jgi:hypothetical protein
VVRVIGFDKPGNAGLGGGSVPNRYSRANVIPPGPQVPLMAKKDDGWHPACLVGTVGEEYKVRFIGSDTTTLVKGEHVRHLFAGKPGERMPTGLFWGK